MRTNRTGKHNIWKWTAPAILVFAIFIIFSPQADARIVIEGTVEFTEEVNDCINTYRNTPGIVGDVIRALATSENEHKIINSPSWTNRPNDFAKAMDGTGSGSVTRVDREKLKDYVERVEALKNKDFCTALLHELWHAYDADRGEWTREKIDDVWEIEIRATLFQNFVHAIRGVPPRTHYAGIDISRHVVVGGAPAEEAEESEGEDAGDLTEQDADCCVHDEEEEQESEPAQEQEEEQSAPAEVSMSYEHVAPGQYSEVYVRVFTVPGASITATLTGPGVDSTPTQGGSADDEGMHSFTWRIVSFGAYTVTGTVNGVEFSSSINVQ